MKVLLIEDDDFIARMYAKKFTLEKFVTMVANDGEAGLMLAKKELPNIILLDIMLPKMNGWEVLEQLKRDPSTQAIPVILLTNIGAPEDIQKGFDLGAVDYLIKAHFIPDEVVKKINSIVTP
ncbi:MAG: response regulator [Candidatus Kerfeldbacteria bacterium]|nr:response regulator [Candidatus Kerfeldbacteria bacterium]